jgi:hypothetical protein
MKRFAVAILTLFALAIPLTADAGRWVTKEIFWKISGLGPTGTSTTIWVRDTSKVVFGGRSTTADTTGTFTLNEADVPLRGSFANPAGAIWSASATDSVEFAYLLFQTDSSAMGTPTIGTGAVFTVVIEGRVAAVGPASVLSSGWVTADSIVIATGRGALSTFAVPIRTNGMKGGAGGISIRAYEELRAYNGATGVGYLPSARAFLRYYTTSER